MTFYLLSILPRSILHFYESLGFWRAGADLRKVHFAEEWNELHHLQASRRWPVRLVIAAALSLTGILTRSAHLAG